MKASEFLRCTQKERPKEAVLISHQWLVRGGFVEQVSSGIFSYLPLGFLVLQKIKNLIRNELQKEGVLEVLMPVVHPARLWKESSRYYEIQEELLRAKGREEEFVLAMTHEETVTDMVRKSVKSYEELPFILNQFQTKFRDEPRPRGGLLRLKEFLMQDAYSFDRDEKGMEISYKKIAQAYKRIFQILDLPVVQVMASSGMMGGTKSEELMLIHQNGEDTFVECEQCGYRANMECAVAQIAPPVVKKKMVAKEVNTPKVTSVLQVASFLGVHPSQIIKTLVFQTKQGLVFVLIRGDREVNKTKLASILGSSFQLATADELAKSDLIPGFVSPLNQKKIPVYADISLKNKIEYVVGGNKTDTHLTGISLDDLDIKKFVDISEVQEGDRCATCGGKLKLQNAIELGHLFQLGTKYSEKMKAYFTDNKGKRRPIFMGCFGIGLDRVMAAIIETHHDEKGIIWPKAVAPFMVYLMNIANSDKAKKITEQIYQKLLKRKVEVFYDDRERTAGFKFAEADLMGCPYRLTVSRRSLEKDAVELKYRDKDKVELIKISQIEKLWKTNLFSLPV
jgi:prolyl-tRNA synthetase